MEQTHSENLQLGRLLADALGHHSTPIYFMFVPQLVSQIPERTTPTCIFSSRRQLRRFFLLLFVQLSADSLDGEVSA